MGWCFNKVKENGLPVSDLLLEIGTEELPAQMAKLVIPQLEEKVRTDFSDLNLHFDEISCSSTPRRIVVIVRNMHEYADDVIEIKKGPPSSQAYKDGSPTQSAIGFAKRLNVSVEELEIQETSKGPFVFAKVVEKGKPSIQILKNCIPMWISHIHGKRFMRWGEGATRFSRPIRWVLALFDNKVLDIKLLDCDPNIISSNITRGHRLYKETIEIKKLEDYEDALEQEGVIVDRDKRASIISNFVKDISYEMSAYADLNSQLLDELTDLVESPNLIVGSFESTFLQLPPEVLSKVMLVHQRYIPLYLKKGSLDPLLLDSKDTLLPKFLCISNGLETASNTIRTGNERVLRARFSDAEFFFNLDLSISSDERLEKLKSVNFSEGLGSLYERVERIQWLSLLINDQLKTVLISSEDINKAAKFCKHDLVSNIVGEFPELQGLMGAKYLLAEGYSRDIALAVLEHYLPRIANGPLPTSNLGSILALAERVEILVSIFAKGNRPSGSSDPYALRRAANGLFQIVWEKDWDINIFEIISKYVNYLSGKFPSLRIIYSELMSHLNDFLRQRFISLLEERQIDIDIVQSVAAGNQGIEKLLIHPLHVLIRAELLMKLRKEGKLNQIQNVVIRVSRLAAKSDFSQHITSPKSYVDISLFEEKSESRMLALCESIDPIAYQLSKECYKELAHIFLKGSNTMSEFFDGENSVMVMSEDLSLRENRLKLLAIIRNQASLLCDFNQLNS